MAEVKQGKIRIVSSLTDGIVEYLDGTLDAYSDATLPTRGIALAPGDLVIGYQNPTLGNIVPLQPVYDAVLEQLLAKNDLSSSEIKNSLQFYNCCAQKKGQEYIDGLTKGRKCISLYNDAILMKNMVDRLWGFVPKDEVIKGRQATYLIIVTGVGNHAFNMEVNITIGVTQYIISIDDSPVRTTENVAQFIANFINTLYDNGYPYYAYSSGDNVVLSGLEFDEDNDTVVALNLNNGSVTGDTPQELFGGTEKILQSDNAITTPQAQMILTKLNQLCSKPCDEVVNFAA